MKSIGRELDPAVADAAGKVSAVIAIRATNELHQCATGDDAQRMMEDGHEIEYAVYQGNEREHTRFPQSGYIRGNVRDLVDFIRPAAEPQDTIDRATEVFENGVADAAILIQGCARQHRNRRGHRDRAAPAVAGLSFPVHPDTKAELEQEKADQNAREQTAKMTAAMLINALAFQQNLAGFSAEVEVDGRRWKPAPSRAWGRCARPPAGCIQTTSSPSGTTSSPSTTGPYSTSPGSCCCSYRPPSPSGCSRAWSKTANGVQEAIKQNDVAGTVFQRLIADRQTLATYYTRPGSTTLATFLAVPYDLDWGDPETLKNYRIADYACGSGGLVLAAYRRARELHRNHGGDPDAIHAHMMENSLTACDIMPAAVHLTSSLLSSVAPRERYTGTRNVLYPYGGTGEFDNKGKPVVDVGSLELLDISATKRQAVLPLNQQMALGATQERRAIEVDMSPLSQSLVIMNPPFTTPTNHAADHAKPGNPAFAAFNTTQAEQKAMSDKVKRLSTGTISDGNAGLGTQFTAIANNMVKPGGHIALILPLSAMLGGSDSPSARSWLKLRGLLADKFNDIIVVSIAQNKDIDSSFSADTDMAEVIAVARSLRDGEKPKRLAYFVNLSERPADKLAAQETAKAIRKTIAGLTRLGTHSDAVVGDIAVATVRLERVKPTEKWTTVRIANTGLVQVAGEMAVGKLRLPRRRDPVPIPMTRMGKIGRVGPVDRDIASGPREPDRGPFSKHNGADSGTEWPFLWNHDSKKQQSMAVAPDSHGIVKPGKEDEAQEIWRRASHLAHQPRFPVQFQSYLRRIH